MFTNFFLELRQAKVPVSIKEYLALMEGMDKHVADYSVDDFYYLSRTILVKDDALFLQAGAGIVADSDPEAEYQETMSKARAMIQAIDMAREGED